MQPITLYYVYPVMLRMGTTLRCVRLFVCVNATRQPFSRANRGDGYFVLRQQILTARGDLPSVWVCAAQVRDDDPGPPLPLL